MENLQKQQIVESLDRYCDRYESQNKAANSLKGVSSATISQMLNGNWDKIKDEMWRNVAAQIGHKEDSWQIAETRDFKLLTKLMIDARDNANVSFIVGDEGTGKTETIKHFSAENRRVYFLRCNDFWTKKTFLGELLAVMGRNSSGYTMYEMMNDIISTVKRQDSPLIILDEADKLNDQILYFFITLYNNLEGHCGFILIATRYLEQRIRKGIASGRKGYPEIFSRGGKRFIELKGVGSADVRAVCAANGIDDAAIIKEIYEDSANDLRRIRKKVEAYKNYVKQSEIA